MNVVEMVEMGQSLENEYRELVEMGRIENSLALIVVEEKLEN